MARTVIERKLTATGAGRCHFEVATRENDESIRRLLRENPMPGNISISLEREPNYFASTNAAGESTQTIVARDGECLAGMGSCSIRNRFVNGRPVRVGYLGALRLAASHAGRFDILRVGYELFHRLQAEAPADFYFTSIGADNHRARRILERCLPGMPSYEFVGDFVTVLLPAKLGFLRERGSDHLVPQELEQLVARLNHFNRGFQLAPVWSVEDLEALESLGLLAEHCVIKGESVAAVWDQRSYKQAIIRGYAPVLRRARSVLNLFAAMTGGTKLPAIGEPVGNAFVSHMIAPLDDPHSLIELVAGLRNVAARRGIELLTLGFASEDPRLEVLRSSFRAREYHSRIYLVHWPDYGGGAGELDERLLAPEVALL